MLRYRHHHKYLYAVYRSYIYRCRLSTLFTPYIRRCRSSTLVFRPILLAELIQKRRVNNRLLLRLRLLKLYGGDDIILRTLLYRGRRSSFRF